MTTYTKSDGKEIVVCDTCGVAEDGTRPNVANLTPVDHGAEMRAHLAGLGFDKASVEGCDLKIKDHCPPCEAKRKAAAP